MNERMEQLIGLLNKYSDAYYFSDKPIVSDAEFDALMDELRALEAATGVVLENSPTRSVAGDVPDSFAPHTHLARLWSLDKVKTIEQLREWAARCEGYKAQAAGNIEYVLEYKFDGLTINLTYDNGRLVQAATRGNGTVGEGILQQAKTIKCLPHEVQYKGLFEVRGECYMRLSVLDELNNSGGEQFKNARNAAAGAIRNIDPAVTASRRLDCVCYNIGYIEGKKFATRREMYDFMKENGLPMSDFIRFGSIDDIANMVETTLDQRDSLDFLIDGMVIKLNDLSLFEDMGFTDKFPRGEIAYKFPAEVLTTTIKDITWEVGRTGKLTPLAHLEPVDFMGVTVKRATLNNYDDMLRKRVGIGSRVLIRRSNDVIPEIIRSVDDVEPECPVKMPTECPACGARIERHGVHAYCPNSLSCKPQIVGRLEHFASKNAMDIEGFSDKTALLVVNELGLTRISQLYELTEADLSRLAGFGDKKAANLLGEIEKSKHCALDSFIFALGIPNIGTKTAKELAAAYKTFDAVRRATVDELTKLPDIGEIVAVSIVDFFSDEHIASEVDRLLEFGVRPAEAAAALKNEFISGKTFVVTGTLSRMGRKQIEDLIASYGGRAAGSVSKNTDYVVAGENAGSKLDKANALGVKVLDEQEFFRMIGD